MSDGGPKVVVKVGDDDVDKDVQETQSDSILAVVLDVVTVHLHTGRQGSLLAKVNDFGVEDR